MRKVLFLFGQLNDDDIEWMLQAGKRLAAPAGTVLIRQGQPADSLFILLEGRLAVFLGRRQEREIARLGAGEIVGEMSFVDSRPPSATVRSSEDSIVFAVGRSSLNARLAADAGFAARFYKALAIYLSNSLRVRHRLIGFGENLDQLETADQEEAEDPDELDANVLDTVYLAGERFDRMVRSVMGS
jgi:CRP/FNR family cyclic AMP-dependent transcriptional regulator